MIQTKVVDERKRTPIRVAICSACGRYGQIADENGRCVCSHNHPDLHGRYNGCRTEACQRIAKRKAERADRPEVAAA